MVLAADVDLTFAPSEAPPAGQNPHWTYISPADPYAPDQSPQGNWSSTGGPGVPYPGYPDNTATLTFRARVGAAHAVDQTGVVTIDALANEGLIRNGGTLTVVNAGAADPVVNDGVVENSGTFRLANGSEIGGSGRLTLVAGTFAPADASAATNAAGHTIDGHGTLVGNTDGGTVVNHGLVDADVAGQSIGIIGTEPTPLLNTGTLRASNGGSMYFYHARVEQQGAGAIVADAGTVSFDGQDGATRVTGGRFVTMNGGTIAAVRGGATFRDITNDGTFTVAGPHAFGGTISGTGAVVLQGGGISPADASGWTNAQTVRGYGSIAGLPGGSALVNHGLVDADVAGQSIGIIGTEPTPLLNTGTLRATNGGSMYFYHARVEQQGAGAIVADGGTVAFDGRDNATHITGGRVEARAGSTVLVSRGVVGFAGVDFLVEGTLDTTNGAAGIAGDGEVAINGGAWTSASDVRIGDNGGTGLVAVSGAGSNWTHAGNVYVGAGAAQAAPPGAGTLAVADGGTAVIAGTLSVGHTGVVNLQPGGSLSVGSLDTAGNPDRVAWTGGALHVTVAGLAIGPGGQLGPSLTLQPGMSLTVAQDTTVTASGSLVIAPGGTFSTGGTLTIADGATVTASSGLPAALTLGGVSADGTGAFDLGDNALVLKNTTRDAVQSLITRGYDGGTCRGAGIHSSAAANAPNFDTAIGFFDNAEVQLPSFSGVTLTGPEILVKYTYYGDADLTGVVDTDDFQLFLAGYQDNTLPRTWFYGDFDYTGVIDTDDFQVFLYGYQNQGGPLSELSEALASAEGISSADRAFMQSAIAAVPEPATPLALTLGGISLVTGRRRCRRSSLCSGRRTGSRT